MLLVLNNFIKKSVNDKIKKGNLMLVKHTGFQAGRVAYCNAVLYGTSTAVTRRLSYRWY